MHRAVNSVARRDLKKQGKFGVDAWAQVMALISRLRLRLQPSPQGRAARQTPQNRRRLFQTEFTTHVNKHSHIKEFILHPLRLSWAGRHGTIRPVGVWGVKVLEKNQ